MSWARLALPSWLQRRVWDEQRWLMVDVETSGLDARRDELLAIAALALQPDWRNARLWLCPADSFEVTVRPRAPSARDNILVHGLGHQAQLSGLAPEPALERFRAFAAHSPLLGFHAAFDEKMLLRASRQHLKTALPNPWLDVADLCALAYPGVKAKALDEWLVQFGIACPKRHQASVDVWVQALLLQRIWPRLMPQCQGRRSNWAGLLKLAVARRWVQH